MMAARLHRWSRRLLFRITPPAVGLAVAGWAINATIGVFTLNDYIRWGWTVATGLGVVFGIWNLREVLIDNWALSTAPQHGVAVLKLQTHNAVIDHALILAAIMADFAAGVFSLMSLATPALGSLLLSALLLIVLSFSQTQRRRRLFATLRLRRSQAGDGGLPNA